jgi:signal transduction histidine kinase
MLDAPIYRDGRAVGVVCFEHRGGPRDWTRDDITFALSMADIVAQLFATNELREAEAALHERERSLSQTLASDAIGRLSRSVAHDLNNVLTLVLAAAGNLERNAGEPALVAATAAELRAAARDAAKLTRKLLTYAEPTPPSSSTSLDAILTRLESRLRQIVGDDRVFSLSTAAGPAEIALDEAQIEQLLASLVGNARDATGPGGHVSISTQRTNRAAIILVEDDGEGMDELTLARAIEPFFTTRTDPSRRGLGLAIVSGIVRSAGGNLEIDSRPDDGTRARIQLPIRAPATM